MGTSSVQSLYARLVGPAWEQLPPALRLLHAEGGVARGRGQFRVCHGEGLLARVLARCLRLPRPGEDVLTELSVEPHPKGEYWRRQFAGQRMTTHQGEGPERTMLERQGLAVLRFRLEVNQGGIDYHQVGAKVGLGWFSIPMPRWAAPRVSARETAVGDTCIQVQVEVCLPLVGRIITYEGRMDLLEGPP